MANVGLPHAPGNASARFVFAITTGCDENKTNEMHFQSKPYI
jgi:hypothetical protein